MAVASGRLTWREIVRPGASHPLLPVLVLGLVLGAASICALLLPSSINGPVALIVAAVAVAAAYLLWPRPALLSFALLMLFSRLLARWLAPELAHLDELLMPILVVLAAAQTRPWRNRQWLLPVREAALLAMLAAGVVSALLSGVPLEVWGFGLLLTLKIFGFLYVVLWHDFTATDVRQLYPVVLGLALIVLVIGILEALDPTLVRQTLNLGNIGKERASLPSIKSLLWHPSTFAWFSAFVAVFLFAGHVVLRRWWLLIGGILFSGATVLGARRRALGGLAIALVAGVAATLGRGRAERRMWRGWIPVGIGAFAIVVVFLPSLTGLMRMTIDDLTDSNTARVALYDASVRIATDHLPLGVGFGRFGSAPSRNPYSPVYAEYGLDGIDGLKPTESAFVGDAYWARILGETGVIGFAAMLVFVAALCVGGWRSARAHYSDPLAVAFALGAWMALVHTLVETLTSSMFDSPARIYLLFGTVAVALVLGRTRAEDAAPG